MNPNVSLRICLVMLWDQAKQSEKGPTAAGVLGGGVFLKQRLILQVSRVSETIKLINKSDPVRFHVVPRLSSFLFLGNCRGPPPPPPVRVVTG